MAGTCWVREQDVASWQLIMAFLCFPKCLGYAACKEITCGQVGRKEIVGNIRPSVRGLHGFWPPRGSLAVALNKETEVAQAAPCSREGTHHTNVPGRCFSEMEAVNC